MSLNRRTFARAAAGAAALAAFPALRAQTDRIVLAQSAPFTGPASQLGIQFHQGARLCLEQVNAQGGLNKKPIELVKLDDGYEPDRCAENTRKLLSEDPLALFGYIGTPTSVAALPLATAAKTPFIAPFTGAMALRQPFNRYAFHVRASYNDETAAIVRQLTNLGLNKVAVFYQNDAYGKAGLDGVQLALAAQNAKPVAVATVERNSVDVAAAVRTLTAARPDAIVQVGAYKACAAFIKGAKAAGYGGTFYNVSFVGTQALADELGKDGAGVVVSQVMPSPYSLVRPISREFVDAVRKAGGDYQANFSSMEGYLAAKVMVEALRRGPAKPTSETLVASLEGLGTVNLGGFNITMSTTDHVASSFVELSMLTGDGRIRT
ncbi:MAG TPA: ABC transporter substrate-binding protein [Ramlibacter sp.]|jgi:ABC-type branched-subunit amino acid transport system substrate-binding protein|uniref:ABC transporter substrate-binding protein n=1 Tax=Ramlibacter sp. TaxID=1917967 RepID=UPI002D394C70|nr:ABC transporter substrate-binding protein [Ramlibacter sp.]HZY18432.1 ABC transporter substrate-binding protein [Ramlibacter sp.]